MKTILNSFFSAAVCAAALTGCAMLGGERTKMNVGPSIPSAEASVKYRKASNDNTSIELTVKHLADPAKLTPPAHNYVVWVRAKKDSAAQNIGELTVDSNLNGSLSTVTALHTFDLFVTAEGSGQVQQPTGVQVLWTSHNE